MAVTNNAISYQKKIFSDIHPIMMDTDPEFLERFYNFAYHEQYLHNPVCWKHILMRLHTSGARSVDILLA